MSFPYRPPAKHPPVEYQEEERDPRRFIPTRYVGPLGPARTGVSTEPSYMRPGTRNSVVPGKVNEWTEPADMGEGLYPDGTQRNSAVAGDDDLIEDTPEDEARRRQRRAGSYWDNVPRHPDQGYEGAPLPTPNDPAQYLHTPNIPDVSQENVPGAGNQAMSYKPGQSQDYRVEEDPEFQRFLEHQNLSAEEKERQWIQENLFPKGLSADLVTREIVDHQGEVVGTLPDFN